MFPKKVKLKSEQFSDLFALKLLFKFNIFGKEYLSEVLFSFFEHINRIPHKMGKIKRKRLSYKILRNVSTTRK
jgi:hypothetical protein